MISAEQYNSISTDTDHPLYYLWFEITAIHDGNAVVSNEESFFQRREDFLDTVRKMLIEGKIRLHKNGVFWKMGVEEQVSRFREAWPKSEAASGYKDFYWWFVDEACPAGVAWRNDRGEYVIAP